MDLLLPFFLLDHLRGCPLQDGLSWSIAFTPSLLSAPKNGRSTVSQTSPGMGGAAHAPLLPEPVSLSAHIALEPVGSGVLWSRSLLVSRQIQADSSSCPLAGDDRKDAPCRSIHASPEPTSSCFSQPQPGAPGSGWIPVLIHVTSSPSAPCSLPRAAWCHPRSPAAQP